MKFPLQLRFKFFALAPQMYVQDASGAEVCYVKQKMFRLKEKVEVFSDSSRKHLLCTIAADRMLDFNACYDFRSPDGQLIGRVRRRGMRSIWKAHYEILDEHGQVEYDLHELNPFAKFIDGFFGEIPVIGMFSGFFFHPSYGIMRNGKTSAKMTKRRSFLESRFDIEEVEPIPASDELRIVLSLLMFVLLERSRG